MQYIVEVEYGYYESDDTYHGPLTEKVIVEAEDATAAEKNAWEQIQTGCGTDQLTGAKIISVREQVLRCDACGYWEWENTGSTGIPNGKCTLHHSYPDGCDVACADAKSM